MRFKTFNSSFFLNFVLILFLSFYNIIILMLEQERTFLKIREGLKRVLKIWELERKMDKKKLQEIKRITHQLQSSWADRKKGISFSFKLASRVALHLISKKICLYTYISRIFKGVLRQNTSLSMTLGCTGFFCRE